MPLPFGLMGRGFGGLGAARGRGRASAYVGPGDIRSGAKLWYGFRGYSAAYSTGSNPCCDIVRASDSTTQTINILSNGAIDLATAVAFLAATTGVVSKLYDQSGGGLHLTQSTSAQRPTFALNVSGSHPALRFVRASSQSLINATGLTQAQPVTVVAASSRTGNNTSTGVVIGNGTTSDYYYNNAPNTVAMYNGTSAVTATASDAAFHVLQWITNNADQSSITVDSTTTNTGDPGSGGFSGQLYMGSDAIPDLLTADVFEAGVWSGVSSGAQLTSMYGNVHTYWGF